MSPGPTIMPISPPMEQAADAFLSAIGERLPDDLNPPERLAMAIQILIQALDREARFGPPSVILGIAAALGWAISDFSGETQGRLMQDLVHQALHHANEVRAQEGGQTHGQFGHA